MNRLQKTDDVRIKAVTELLPPIAHLYELPISEAAAAHGVTAPTARKWLGCHLAGGEVALSDVSPRPARSQGHGGHRHHAHGHAAPRCSPAPRPSPLTHLG